jgi:Uma2 family endonuclease
MGQTMAQSTLPLYSYAEYLERLEASQIRLEFVSGLVYAMAGGTPEHNRIVMRLTLLVGNQLAPPCEAYGSDQKIRTSHAGFFPDLLVVCGNPRVAVDDPNAFTNPSIVFEVLSASTAAIDQTTKADEYKSLPSLKAYVLIWQNEKRVQVHQRSGAHWKSSDYFAEELVELEPGITFPVRDLYPGEPAG